MIFPFSLCAAELLGCLGAHARPIFYMWKGKEAHAWEGQRERRIDRKRNEVRETSRYIGEWKNREKRVEYWNRIDVHI